MRIWSAITAQLKAKQVHSQQTHSKQKTKKRFDLKLESHTNYQERDVNTCTKDLFVNKKKKNLIPVETGSSVEKEKKKPGTQHERNRAGALGTAHQPP